MSKQIASLLQRAAAENKLVLTDAIQSQLTQYLELMLTWNRVFNLTSITDPKEMVYLHLIDSLLVAPHLHGNKMLDIGTGAGLPGIPLAILHPEQHWTLLDKNNKKTRFLTQAVATLGLKNVTVAHTRGEDFQPPHRFDSILSRAFGTLHLFTETTAHLLADDGLLIAMKGKYPQDELNEVPDPFKVVDIIPVTMQGMTIERHIIRLKRAI